MLFFRQKGDVDPGPFFQARKKKEKPREMNNLVSGTAAAVLLFGVTAHHVAAYHVPQFMFASSAPTLSRACTKTCSFGFRRVSGIRSRSIVGRQGRSQLQMSENKVDLLVSDRFAHFLLNNPLSRRVAVRIGGQHQGMLSSTFSTKLAL